ncbi:MAG: hypothetical protein Q4F28_02970 [Eubacteriales bacterium]|nr:hypothetical protein [Eubacteriales bacterium]
MITRKQLIIGICGFVICYMVLLLGIRGKRADDLETYHSELKSYVMQIEAFSEKEKTVICIAIDHIVNPDTISDSHMITAQQLSEIFETGDQLGTVDGKKIELNDWNVTIGDTSQHANFTAIIDGDSLEFKGQIPIA